jgi:HAD superfamily hydrolase (TIGR01509 family)
MPAFLSEEQLKAFSEELEEYRSELFKKEYLQRVQPFPEARTLIAKITADGKKVALASSAKQKELEHYKELLGVEDFLDGETNADDADQSKPEPDIFLAAMAELGNPEPEETVVIGDTPYDAIAARKAGLQTIGVLCGGFPEEWLRDEGCVEIYKSPADLLARYEESLLCEKKKQSSTTE